MEPTLSPNELDCKPSSTNLPDKTLHCTNASFGSSCPPCSAQLRFNMNRRPEHIDTDMRRLQRMLDRVLKADNDTPSERPSTLVDPTRSDSPTRILDLACGACDEAETLVDYFASLKTKAAAASAQGAGKHIELTGIDVRAREIADAARRFRSTRKESDDLRAEFEFLNGDATKIDDHRELGENFDVVFMRHQNLWNGRRTWEEMFDKALQKLDDDGRLIITSYFDREHQLALESIQQLGGELIVSEQNETSRKLVTAGKSIDRHVAVFRKKR